MQDSKSSRLIVGEHLGSHSRVIDVSAIDHQDDGIRWCVGLQSLKAHVCVIRPTIEDHAYNRGRLDRGPTSPTRARPRVPRKAASRRGRSRLQYPPLSSQQHRSRLESHQLAQSLSPIVHPPAPQRAPERDREHSPFGHPTRTRAIALPRTETSAHIAFSETVAMESSTAVTVPLTWSVAPTPSSGTTTGLVKRQP